jgi:hypothetical protein
MDNANPLFGWDLEPAIASGARHGATRADAYGCLFFHLKEQFEKFASRAKGFKLNITLSQANALELSRRIPAGSVPNFHTACFDRIETSNLADYCGPSQVINDWAPLLNKANPHSVLLMNFMNWIAKQPNAQVKNSAYSNMNKSVIDKTAAILVRLLKFHIATGGRMTRSRI